jgi:hypothetical protein
MRRAIVLVLLAVSLSGCYRAVVTTGLTPSPTVVTEDWAHSFLYGLVPPEEIDGRAVCPSGVATVQTEHSFLNSVAAVLTWGVYTPITIRVTCATAPTR